MIVFYDKMPDMECLAGDTLPTFTVSVDADSLSGSSMQLIIADENNPTKAVVCKECTAVDGEFCVTLDSSDTDLPDKVYDIHFRFIGADGLSRRKLSGKLYVRAAAHGSEV